MDIHDIHNISTTCTRTEFVGTAVLDTIGLVISGVDDSLLQQMNVGTKYHCLGLFSSRTGAAHYRMHFMQFPVKHSDSWQVPPPQSDLLWLTMP